MIDLRTKSPLQQIDNPNGEVVVISDSPLAKPHAVPAFGETTPMKSIFRRKEPSVFIPPKNRNRADNHKDLYRGGKGPLAPKSQSVKPTALQMFSSMAPTAQPAVQYSQSAAAYEDQVFYTDPDKASADLKALLEGGMEDEEEEDQEKIDDGSLEGISVKLLPHQVEGVQWMRGRELGPVKKGKVPKGGILADDMGLGKTLQSISLIVSNQKPEGPDSKGWKKHFEEVQRGTLVVAPLALIRQWEAEIKDKVAKSHLLTVCVHHGPQRTKSSAELSRFDVVITTYQILVSEHASGSGCFDVNWYRVILDEAHSIKNRNAKATKAACALTSEYRWCLTGTPMQNNLDELQSLVHFLRIQPYSDLAEWRAHIDGPLKNGKGHIAIRRLHSILRCFMKRRTKEILKEEGALVAGGKKAIDAAAAKAKKEGKQPEAPKTAFKITERKVVTVAAEFSPAEREFYDKLEARADERLEEMMKGKVNYANALVLLLRLRQACNHPRLVEAKVDKDKEALTTDTAQSQTSSSQNDMDDLADAFGGMGIETKKCDMCLGVLSKQDIDDGQLRCSSCNRSLEALNDAEPQAKKSKKKGRRVSVVSEKVKIEARRRKARGRKIITDSDDEDEEGSWLVPDDQRGSLRLGKAGGEEDENAEGGGEDIGSEDSDHSSEEEDGSQLGSFVVNDEDDDGNATSVSVSRIASQMTSSQKSAELLSGSETDASDSEKDSGVSESELNSDSDSDNQVLRPRRMRGQGGKRDGDHIMMSAKIRELISIISKEVSDHKFIVFSQFTSMLDLVEPFFRAQAGFKFVRYDGNMRNDAREATLHALRTDPHTRILLCSLKCGSLGLNLTAATRVVILEPFWNPFVEEQAIDRVHRLTQTVDVVVYKLTVADTVEERIIELQEKKRRLAEMTVEGGMKKKDKNALKLGLKEILDLFKHDSRHDYDPAYVDDVRGARRNPSNNRAVVEDVRSMVGLTRRPPQREESQIYGRRW
jgi:SNF2 family DNA or RNA helicase